MILTIHIYTTSKAPIVVTEEIDMALLRKMEYYSEDDYYWMPRDKLISHAWESDVDTLNKSFLPTSLFIVVQEWSLKL